MGRCLDFSVVTFIVLLTIGIVWALSGVGETGVLYKPTIYAIVGLVVLPVSTYYGHRNSLHRKMPQRFRVEHGTRSKSGAIEGYDPKEVKECKETIEWEYKNLGDKHVYWSWLWLFLGMLMFFIPALGSGLCPDVQLPTWQVFNGVGTGLMLIGLGQYWRAYNLSLDDKFLEWDKRLEAVVKQCEDDQDSSSDKNAQLAPDQTEDRSWQYEQSRIDCANPVHPLGALKLVSQPTDAQAPSTEPPVRQSIFQQHPDDWRKVMHNLFKESSSDGPGLDYNGKPPSDI